MKNSPDTYQQPSDQMIPRSAWYPALWNFFLRLAESYPEKYRLAAIRREAEALEKLGDAPRSVIERTCRHLHGALTQNYWYRQGFTPDEMFLDDDGNVIAVLLPERFFESAKPHLNRLAGAWVTADESFSSPDGARVCQAGELEKLWIRQCAGSG